jgi:flavin reductase (DIM6/NTAB) family NADH-FMN oxidoreductase RutF
VIRRNKLGNLEMSDYNLRGGKIKNMSHFIETNPDGLSDNVFRIIGQEWMLITAGSISHYNTMTASWGGWGILWNRKVCTCVIRPQRYTYEFMENTEVFSLTFFEPQFRAALDFCGTHSGRKVDKAKECGLTPYEIEVAGTLSKTVTFSEARLVLACKKLYFHDLDPRHFIDPTIGNAYPSKDYHRMYIGEIVHCLIRDEQS